MEELVIVTLNYGLKILKNPPGTVTGLKLNGHCGSYGLVQALLRPLGTEQ